MVDRIVTCDICIKLLTVFLSIVIAYELNPELTEKTVTFFNNLFEKISEYSKKVETETTERSSSD